MTGELLLPEQEQSSKLSFIDTFLGTLLAPVQTFRQLALESINDTSALPGAFFIVILAFALDGLRLTPGGQLGWALINVPGEITGGLALWLLSAIVVSMTALCFGADMAKVRACFVTLGWSLLPWIFLGPLACFAKIFGTVQVLFMAIPLAWIIFLQVVAVKQSFQMKIWQALVLVMVLPPTLSSYQTLQFIQSLTATLGYLFN